MNYNTEEGYCKRERGTNEDILREEAKYPFPYSSKTKAQEGKILNSAHKGSGCPTFNPLNSETIRNNKNPQLESNLSRGLLKEGEERTGFTFSKWNLCKSNLLCFISCILIALCLYFLNSKSTDSSLFGVVDQYYSYLDNTLVNQNSWVSHYLITEEITKMQRKNTDFDISSENEENLDDKREEIRVEVTTSTTYMEETTVYQTTNDIYGIEDMTIFNDKYQDIRKSRDYEYHRNYKLERQQLQDEIIDQFLSLDPETRRLQEGKDGALQLENQRSFYIQCPDLSDEDTDEDESLDASKIKQLENDPNNGISSSSSTTTCPSTSPTQDDNDVYQVKKKKKRKEGPWIVFTAGAMGAGKSHVLKWLAKKGYFPLDDFVFADPDMIRHHLPEYKVVAEKSPEKAGYVTHREASFMTELLTLACLKEKRNVLIQGTLRDYEWHRNYFNYLRKEFPGVKIAIIHVIADANTVFQRARKRGEETGRMIPEEVLTMALEETPKAVNVLQNHVEYCAVISNNDNSFPYLQSSSQKGVAIIEEKWASFAMRWCPGGYMPIAFKL